MQITSRAVVAFEHTLKNEHGVVLETSVGTQPIRYLHGFGNFLSGLEAALEGKEVGDDVTVVLTPESGHGLRDERLVRKIAVRKLSAERVVVGQRYNADLGGTIRAAVVLSVQGDYATVDGNHPLSGMTLHFQVKIVDVRAASAEELAHGHVHGTGGHAH